MSKVAPSSIAEVVALIRDARHDQQPLWFMGSGSTETPSDHLTMSTEKLVGIVDYQPDDLIVVVRAGTTLAELDDTLEEHGQSAVLPETTPNRTVGGVVASGASGYRRHRYGPTSNRVIGATIVTGYGEVVHAGGQLVKNVTGFDLPRLVTGSYGSLGFIAEISLKLWPTPSAPRTVRVEDAGSARTRTYQPIAALETETGGLLYTSDPGASTLEGPVTEEFTWPDPIDERVVAAVNVPARLVAEAIARLGDSGATRFVAQHGVGVIDVGWADIDEAQIVELRAWTEAGGGSLVIHRRGPLSETLSRWGGAPASLDIQFRLKDLFDPDRICNPGVLPGGV